MEGDEAAVLGFASRHEAVLGAQVRAFLGIDEASERMAVGSLVRRGYVQRVRLGPGFDAFACSPAGCEMLDLEPSLATAALVAGGLRRAVGAVWVWIRAQDGRFSGASVLSGRELLGDDLTALSAAGSRAGNARPFGLRLGGVASPTETRLHYPNVLVRFRDEWCAVHLQLGPIRAEELLAWLRAYGADERYGRVVFLVERERVGRQIEAAALSAGVSGMASVQWMAW